MSKTNPPVVAPQQTDIDAERAALEDQVRDAVNQLSDFMGTAIFMIPSRNANGLVVAVGTPKQVVDLLKGAV